jgi:hypothetical protein
LSNGDRVYDVHAGDIFTIPLDTDDVYVGQVICEYKSSWFVVIFDHRTSTRSARENPTDALSAAPLLGSIVFDARFRPGMWEIVGNSDVDPEKYAPAYTMGDARAGGIEVVNFLGTKRREATTAEATSIPRIKLRSPLVLEKAVRAHAGLEPWLDAFNDLTMDRQRRSVDIFGTI